MRVIDHKMSKRAKAYDLWIKAPNPMVTFIKTIDVTPLIKIKKKHNLKFNMLFNYCIGKAASSVEEFFILPVGDELIQYDTIAINHIVKNKDGEVSSCDILFSDDLMQFNQDYLKYSEEVERNCKNRDLVESMVIGTSAVINVEIDGAIGMNSGIFNNPFIIWGKYKRRLWRYALTISFQFHHTQMDGLHAGKFLDNLQKQIYTLRV